RMTKNVNRYTKNQLDAYIANLDEFTKRSTKFVRGAQGAPIPLMDYNLYKMSEGLYNRTGYRLRRRNENLKMPGEDMTVGEYAEQREALKSFINAPDNTMLPTRNLTPASFTDVKKLRASRRLLERRMGANYLRLRHDATARATDKALGKKGQDDMRAKSNSLTREQQNYLSIDTRFDDNVYPEYE